MDSSRHLDYLSFRDDIRRIVEISDSLGEEWRLLLCKKTDRQYMVRKVVFCIGSSASSLSDNESAVLDTCQASVAAVDDEIAVVERCQASVSAVDDDLEEIGIEDDDIKFTAVSTGVLPSGCISCEYHVIYNSSYEIPVLYFNMHMTDGKLLSLDQIWKLVPQQQQDRLEGNLWLLVTQAEHPVLGRPFYQLHPCHTGKMMAKLYANESSSSIKNYVLTWLSAVGPMVGMQVSPSYFQA